jgi:hypothetical protein
MAGINISPIYSGLSPWVGIFQARLQVCPVPVKQCGADEAYPSQTPFVRTQGLISYIHVNGAWVSIFIAAKSRKQIRASRDSNVPNLVQTANSQPEEGS